MNIAACEELATKAELQELRDQINNLLGKTEEGGQINVLQAGTLAGTFIASGLVFDLEIISDVGSQATNIVKKGLGGIQKTLSGATKGLSRIASTGKAGLKAADAALQASAGLMVDIATIGIAVTNLATIIAQGKRIDSLEKSLLEWQNAYYDVYSHLWQARENIEVAKENIVNLESDLATSEGNVEILQGEVQDNEVAIESLEKNLAISQNNNAILKNNVEVVKEDLANYQEYAEEEIDILQADIQTLQENQEIKDRNFEILKETTIAIGNQNAKYQGDLTELSARFGHFSTSQTIIKRELIEMNDALEEEITLTQSKVIILAQRIRRLEDRPVTGGGGGVALSVQDQIAANQNDTINTFASLLGNPSTVQDRESGEVVSVETNITYQDIVNGESNFPTIIKAIASNLPDLSNYSTEEQVNQEQLNTTLGDFGVDLKDGINTDVERIVTAIVGTALVPPLADISSKVSPAAITDATTNAICNSTSPNGCLTRGITNPLSNGLNALGNNLPTAIGAINAAQNIAILKVVNANKALLTDKLFGLQALKNAFNSTITDKVLNVVNTSLLFHNAIMLSGQIGETLGDVASIVLNVAGVKALDGTALDVNEIIGRKLSNLVRGLIGSENYTALTNRLATANRIYQAGQNILNDVTDIVDGTNQILEETGGNVAKIGNALRESGTIDFDSYSDMREEMKSSSKVFRKLEALEEVTDKVYSITSEVQSVQESFNDIKESREELTEAVNEYNKLKEEEERVSENSIERLD